MDFQNLKTQNSSIQDISAQDEPGYILLKIEYIDAANINELYDYNKLPEENFNLFEYITEEKKEQFKTLIHNKIGFKGMLIDSRKRSC
jgi:hypothetical protein